MSRCIFTKWAFMTRKQNENLIKKIKIAMAEVGLNQTSLAEKLGVKPNTISQWLSGTNSPKLETLKKVARATGKNINYFFDSSTQVSGNSNVVGKNINISADVEKDIKLLSTQVELLSAKIKILETEIQTLKKRK